LVVNEPKFELRLAVRLIGVWGLTEVSFIVTGVADASWLQLLPLINSATAPEIGGVGRGASIDGRVRGLDVLIVLLGNGDRIVS
jgi:hypothetical protein